MKEQGFTLVELLGVLIILAVIFVIVTPTVSNIITESKETIYQKQINTILTAAYDFSLKNISYLPDEDKNIDTTYITVGELKYEGLIDINITNPNTNEKFPDNLVISIQNKEVLEESSNIEDPYMIEGNYLYMLKISQLEEVENLPNIILYDEEENELNSYTQFIELNEEVPNFDKYSVSVNEENVKVIKYILKNDVVVDHVETSNLAIYKINYTVINSSGYANSLILNITIVDTILPTITFPEENTISKDDIEDGLLEEFIKKDVTCTDNSGFCDIKYPSVSADELTSTGITIKYEATDPSGNTIAQERYIEIE